LFCEIYALNHSIEVDCPSPLKKLVLHFDTFGPVGLGPFDFDLPIDAFIAELQQLYPMPVAEAEEVLA
jgi:hypothetical protein